VMYELPLPTDGLTQGDILDECPVFRHEPDGRGIRIAGRGIVLTQACDLDQQKARLVLIALVYPADAYLQRGGVKASTVRDQVRLGKMFGLYFLPEAPSPIPVGESVVDLRELHTVPRAVSDALVAAGKRPARLAVPYREHLAQHFAVTYMRVALPGQYPTAP
jgi:hypothetical protein